MPVKPINHKQNGRIPPAARILLSCAIIAGGICPALFAAEAAETAKTETAKVEAAKTTKDAAAKPQPAATAVVKADATAKTDDAAKPAAAIKPPAYSVIRHAENWSAWGNQEYRQDNDLFDSIKFVPLNEGGSVWISFGGQFRFRAESWSNFGFGSATISDSDVYPLGRALLHADLHIKNRVRFFVQGKSAVSGRRNLAGGTRGLEADSIDLQNFFVDVIAPAGEGTLTFRVGRQELLFGKQRLVSPLDWANTRRTFDGFSAALNLNGWKATGFFTHPVPVRKYSFNKAATGTDFFGLYTSGKVAKVGLDVYWLGVNRPVNSFNGTSGREERQTVGARVGGKISDGAVSYDLETAFQFGTVGVDDISAYMFASKLGYAFAGVRMAPSIYAGFDYASGDGSAGGNVGTFSQLFPLAHAYNGFIDLLARQNIIDQSSGVTFKPVRKLLVKVDWHNFWRANTSDGIYNAGAGLVRPGAAGVSRDVGRELDLTLKYPLDRHMVIIVGFSHFFAGDFIRESGSSQGINFGYTTLQYTF